ncbi:hypothetical protein OE88DRAFT_998180 [Heliocybe sulcata]|uniref:Uncharacterized protein n=1 Tax=Heliocybe sulcata TaxID=5364 RepID=A0A5C3NN84_9AGAM|nr:hypothetical protein OE88DRAFT_998180 [Heliocybe sulcata]
MAETGQSRPYPQDNGWPPREPRHHRARGHRPQQPRNHRHNHTGEHWPQHHGSHHYDHGRDVGTPPIPRRDETSTCDREQRKSPRQADRLQTRKEHPTVSELESGIPSGLQTDERSNKEPDERSMEKTQEQREEREEETNKQMEGPIEERRHEQDPSASETEHWEDQYEQPDGYPIGDALDFPRDVAILDKQASKDSPRIAQEGDDHRPDYYINDPDHNPWQGSL